ncbi:MAG: 50S ribosomal protein L3 N(5)-glutamine methyltransferase [Pseudomonadales bacterium]
MVGELIDEASAALNSAGVYFGHGTDSAWDEATVLVLSVTGLADDAANLEAQVSERDEAEVRRLLTRRIDERLPLAHLIGRWWFAGYEFLVLPGVVVPRSPIGELIEAGFEPWLLHPPRRVLDLCAGSGCIGIATALTFPDAEVHLVEIDPVAAVLARENVRLHGVEDRVSVHEGDLYEALPDTAGFDLIVSNPPYVDAVDMASLPAEYRHEPRAGLAGGADGLDLVRRIVDGARERLSADGVLVCEVGMSAPALLRAYPSIPFYWPDFERGGEGVFVVGAPDLT